MLFQLLGYVLLSVLPAMVSAPNTLSVFMAFPVGFAAVVVFANSVGFCMKKIDDIQDKITAEKLLKEKVTNKEGDVNA
jgi:hypothetical protein